MSNQEQETAMYDQPGEEESMSEIQKCSMCHRERTLDGMDVYDYSPLQVVTGQPLGWYSGDDGEVCPEDMSKIMGGGDE